MAQEYLYKLTPTLVKPERFEEFVEWIRNTAAYKDPFSKIWIAPDSKAVHFNHPLHVVAELFVEEKDKEGKSTSLQVMLRGHKRLVEKNLGYYCNVAMIECHHPLEKAEPALFKEAENYFSHLVEQTNKKKIPKKMAETPTEQLFSLLSENEGIAIGELHEDQASKKLLIDNMPRLKQQGVETIFLEHISDTFQDALDAFYASPTLEMPRALRLVLEREDRNRGLTSKPYNFVNLVLQAKRCGIRVVAIETYASYFQPSFHDDNFTHIRCSMMNYVAANAFEKNRKSKDNPGKYLFFVGSAHINKAYSGVAGISEITGCPTLVVEDKVEHNAKAKVVETGEQHITKADIVITLDPKDPNHITEEYKSLQEDVQKLQTVKAPTPVVIQQVADPKTDMLVDIEDFKKDYFDAMRRLPQSTSPGIMVDGVHTPVPVFPKLYTIEDVQLRYNLVCERIENILDLMETTLNIPNLFDLPEFKQHLQSCENEINRLVAVQKARITNAGNIINACIAKMDELSHKLSFDTVSDESGINELRSSLEAQLKIIYQGSDKAFCEFDDANDAKNSKWGINSMARLDAYYEACLRKINDASEQKLKTSAPKPAIIVTNKPIPEPVTIKKAQRLSINPVEQQFREELKKDLTRYLRKIDKGNPEQEKDINFSHNFWFKKKSRGLNRKANYYLAQKLLKQLTDQRKPLSDIFNEDNLIAKRDNILSKKGVLGPEYVQRDKSRFFFYKSTGINSSDLNKVIDKANKFINKPTVLPHKHG